MSAEKNETLITGALRVAAEAYTNDAKISVGEPRVAEQFDRQAADCHQLADKIEQFGLDQVAFL